MCRRWPGLHLHRVDRILEVCCKRLTSLHSRRTLFPSFRKISIIFCTVKTAQQLATDKSWRLFATFYFPFSACSNYYALNSPKTEKERNLTPKALTCTPSIAQNISKDSILQCSGKPCFLESSGCTHRRNQGKCNNTFSFLFVCRSATLLTTCMLCVLCGAHCYIFKKEKSLWISALPITEATS